MLEVARYVLDASVAAKWHLRDETFVSEAQQVLDDFGEGRIRLIAPQIIQHEVSSAILKATRHSDRPRRPTLEEGLAAIRLFLRYPLELFSTSELVYAGYQVAGHLGCSYYDGLYLAAAELTSTPYLYADDKLRRTLRERFPLAIWIEDYRHV